MVLVGALFSRLAGEQMSVERPPVDAIVRHQFGESPVTAARR